MADSHDVIVIGSGAGGGAAAWALTEAGAKVLLLESGPAYDPLKDYRLDTPEWELTGFPEKVPTKDRQTIGPLQSLDPARVDLGTWNKQFGRLNRTEQRNPGRYLHCVGLGGTTLRYTGEAHRLNPQSMRMQTRFGVSADWPVDYDSLVPFYQIAERMTGVSGPRQDPLPPHPMSYATKKLGAGCNTLGMSWSPNSVAAPSQVYDGRPNCNYCGNCTLGCSRTDKGSVDLTFIAKAKLSGNLSIETGAHVTRVEAGNNDRVSAVQYVRESAEVVRVSAPVVVVACGAVETPRLLLNSASRRAPDGLANESGLVGRNFLETLFWVSSAMHPEPLGSHRGHPSDAICWDYANPDAIEGVVGGCRFSPAVAEFGLNGPVAYATRVVDGWGKDHKSRMRESFGRVLSIGGIGESLTDTGSYIDLDPEALDEHELPKARIRSHLAPSELDRLTFMRRICRDVLEAAGAGKPFEEAGAYDAFNSTHVFGTCRMGHNPDDSVVDAYCRSYRWKNLYVLDASVFPSSGGGESPALTIEALAIRSAREIVARANRQET